MSSDEAIENTASNLQEVAAGGGKVLVLSDAASLKKARGQGMGLDRAAEGRPLVAPILYAILV